jgi:hypothetical protein
MKESIIRKLTSRKLWLAVALFVSGLITALGGEESVGETVMGCIMQAGAAVSYIFAEGWADAKHDSIPPAPDIVVDGFGN